MTPSIRRMVERGIKTAECLKDGAIVDKDVIIRILEEMMPAGLSPEGECGHSSLDNGDCCICGKQTNNMAGNPDEWSVKMPRPDGTGKLHYYHMGCAVSRIWGATKPSQISIDRKMAERYIEWTKGIEWAYSDRVEEIRNELRRALEQKGENEASLNAHVSHYYLNKDGKDFCEDCQLESQSTEEKKA